MIFRSPYPDIAIPDVSITTFVLQHAVRLADKLALIDAPTGRTLTYGELADGVRRAAAGLARRGFRKGDVAAIYSPNCLEYAIAFHGAASLGGTVATINHLSTIDEVVFYLNDADARVLFAAPELLERALEAAGRSRVEDVFVFGQVMGATPFVSLLENEGTAPDVAIDPRNDVAALCYSSGTTGLCKGVMLTHTNLIADILQCAAVRPATQHDVLVGVLPFYHLYGLVVILNRGLAFGTTIVSLPRYDLVSLLRAVQNYGVSEAPLAPSIFVELAKRPEVADYNLSTLRIANSGGAPLDEGVARTCSTRIGCPVLQGYGMTEACPIHIAPVGPELRKLGSVGPCAPNTECKVMDVANGDELGPCQQGELWVRGPQMMKGYLNQPDATAETIDPAGWLHTGDIGYADEDGWFYIVDRLKELIKYKAYQVAPAELEAVLLAHPAVADAAVIPSPDDEAGEVPKAFVVLKAEATTEELMAFVAARVAPYKKVRRVEFVE